MKTNTRTINKEKLHIAHLEKHFDEGQVFDNKELIVFYRSLEPGVKEATVNWRISSLVGKGIIKRIGRGRFVLGPQVEYIPFIPPKIRTLHNKLKKGYPFLDYCIWTSSLFNEFMQHQPERFFFLVEVEKDALESVFFFMKQNKYSVFLEPTREILKRYVPDEKETWIVKSLVTEAPVKNISGIPSTTIEKLLVDLFCDTIVLDAQQGAEKDRIFNGIFEKYTVNENKMLRYANRRRNKEEFNKYLKTISKFRQQV